MKTRLLVIGLLFALSYAGGSGTAAAASGPKPPNAKKFDALADAALAASIFHFKEVSISDLKRYLQNKHIPIRV